MPDGFKTEVDTTAGGIEAIEREYVLTGFRRTGSFKKRRPFPREIDWIFDCPYGLIDCADRLEDSVAF
jgi:hypothetical protein